MAPSPTIHAVTIRKIAQAARVNISTVSRALRGVSGVSAAERDRIRLLARKLGYRPNPFVAAFTAQVRAYRRSPQVAIIGLLDCWPDQRPAWANFDDSINYMSGIRQRAEALGYQIETIRLSTFDGSLSRLNRMLVTRRIHGLLILPVPNRLSLLGIDFTRLACSTIDFSLQEPVTIRRVSSNYYHNMQMVLTTLLARGYERIGFFTTPDSSRVQDNLSLSAFLAFHFLHPDACVAPCLAPLNDLHGMLSDWLNRNHPDVVVTCDLKLPNDLEATGRRVPDDLGCVCLSRPPFSSKHVAYIDENYREIGIQAVDLIVDAIHRNEFGLPSTITSHFVDGVWHEGRTVRRAPSPTIRR